jgi:hypothetical protein
MAEKAIEQPIGASATGHATIRPPQKLEDVYLSNEFSSAVRAVCWNAAVLVMHQHRASGQRTSIGVSALIKGLVFAKGLSVDDDPGCEVILDVIRGRLDPAVLDTFLNQAGPLNDGGESLLSISFSPFVRQVFRVAQRIAADTRERTDIVTRHLVAALLGVGDLADVGVPASYPGVLARIWKRDWALNPSDLQTALLEAIRRNPLSSEFPAVWQKLLSGPAIAPAAFAADAPRAEDDALGRRGDARRLAELACLVDNAPPLAIGLFGDWGSGKSTFMAMMQAEVERIGNGWKGDDAGPFASRVAQIRFNAWSFADANLWASLAVEIFDGLRDELVRIEDPAMLPLRRHATLLAEISARTEQARQARAEADQAVQRARHDLNEIEGRLRAIDAKLSGPGAVAARVGAIVVARQTDITALLRDLGAIGPTEAATIDRLGEEVRTLAAAGNGGFALLRRVLKLASTRIGVPLVTGIVCVFVAIWLAPPGALQAAAATTGFLAPFAWWIVKALNRLSPLLDAVEADVKAEADLRRERSALADAREAAARALMEREKAAARALSGSEAIEKAAATPQAMLRFFLNESDELRGYQQEIGVIGRLRSSFKRLDDLMAAQRIPGKATGKLPVLDRIILYIDDLDRLREDQVVKVLEAVALLLQFKLFVVVVAVDARWLAGALRRYYRGQLGGQGQAVPGDYLEKIFQVPFWLPRLAPGSDGFAGLARVLLPEGEEVPQAATPVASIQASAPAEGEFAIDPAELPQPGDETPFETRTAEVKRVTLTKPEVEVLAALLPVAARTPRGAKRFVNLYRLARAGRSEKELSSFLGTGDGKLRFPALALALALATASSGKQWAELRWQLREPNRAPEPEDADHLIFVEPRNVISWARDLVRPSSHEGEQSEFDIGYAASIEWERLADLKNVPALLEQVTHYELRRAIEEASHYSFHPAALDRAVAPAKPAASQPGGPA